MTVTVSLPPAVHVATAGTQGPRGNTTLNGIGTPGSTVGIDGDFYYDLASYPTAVTLYGPKAAGMWPAQGVAIGGGGGSGGVTPAFYDTPVGAGIVTLSPAADWTTVIGTNGVHVGRTIPARAGDVILWSSSFLRTGTTMFLDAVIRTTNGGISRFVSSGTATPNTEGYAPWYAQSGSFPGVSSARVFTVQSGEIDASGNWTLEMVWKNGDSSCRVYMGDGYDGYWTMIKWPLGP